MTFVRLIFPIKDFLIAMSIIWLYLDQGLKQQKLLRDNNGGNGNSLIDKDTYEVNNLLSEENQDRTESEMSRKRFTSLAKNGSAPKSESLSIKRKGSKKKTVEQLDISNFGFDQEDEEIYGSSNKVLSTMNSE